MRTVSQPSKPTSPGGPTPSLAHTRAPALLGLNLLTTHHTSPAPRSLTKDSPVDAAHPWSCLVTWWHWGTRSTHHSPPAPEPQREGGVLELGEKGSGTEEKPFFPSEAAEVSRAPQLSPPRCCVPTRAAAGSGVGPMCPQLAERGRMAEPCSQRCVYADLTKPAGK